MQVKKNISVFLVDHKQLHIIRNYLYYYYFSSFIKGQWCVGAGMYWLTKADCTSLLPTPRSMTCWYLEINHGESIYTVVIG